MFSFDRSLFLPPDEAAVVVPLLRVDMIYVSCYCLLLDTLSVTACV